MPSVLLNVNLTKLPWLPVETAKAWGRSSHNSMRTQQQMTGISRTVFGTAIVLIKAPSELRQVNMVNSSLDIGKDSEARQDRPFSAASSCDRSGD